MLLKTLIWYRCHNKPLQGAKVRFSDPAKIPWPRVMVTYHTANRGDGKRS